MTKEEKALFLSFLRRKKVLRRVITLHLEHALELDHDPDFDRYLDRREAEEALMCAFDFERTVEGYGFWKDLDIEWQWELRKLREGKGLTAKLKLDLLMDWLKERKLAWKFVNYYRRDNIYECELIEYVAQTPIEDLILFAFFFSKTEEGIDFWIDVSLSWKKYLEELEKEGEI